MAFSALVSERTFCGEAACEKQVFIQYPIDGGGGKRSATLLRFVRLLRKPPHCMSVAALPYGKPPQHRQWDSIPSKIANQKKGSRLFRLLPYLVETEGIEPPTSRM